MPELPKSFVAIFGGAIAIKTLEVVLVLFLIITIRKLLHLSKTYRIYSGKLFFHIPILRNAKKDVFKMHFFFLLKFCIDNTIPSQQAIYYTLSTFKNTFLEHAATIAIEQLNAGKTIGKCLQATTLFTAAEATAIERSLTRPNASKAFARLQHYLIQKQTLKNLIYKEIIRILFMLSILILVGFTYHTYSVAERAVYRLNFS